MSCEPVGAMAYTPNGQVPRIETSEIVPVFFPGLQKDGDAVAPAVKGYNNKIDIYSVVSLVNSNDVAKQTISNRFNSAISTLKRAYDRVVGLLGPESQDTGLWPEDTVDTKCAELGGKEAAELEKAYHLVVQMPPSVVSFVSWANDRCGTRMIVTKSFLLSFVVEFVHTADAYRLKADLKKQYLLNDAATAEHVNSQVQRHIAHAGTSVQQQALADTGISPDVAPAPALLAASAISSALAAPTQQSVVEPCLTVPTTLAMSPQVLVSMLPEGETRTSVIMSMINASEQRIDEEQRHVEARRDREHEHMMEQSKMEHERKMAVYEQQMTVGEAKKVAIQEERKRKQDEFVQRRDEYAQEKKRRVIDQIERAIDRETNEGRIASLNSKLAILSGVPASSTVAVINPDNITHPKMLHQLIMDNSETTIETRFRPGLSFVDLETEQRLSLQAYTSIVYPSAKLSTPELSRLGKHVSSCCPGVHLKSFAGRYAVNAYFVRDLMGEPLRSRIDEEIKAILNERKAKEASKAHTTTMDAFVAIGKRVA